MGNKGGPLMTKGGGPEEMSGQLELSGLLSQHLQLLSRYGVTAALQIAQPQEVGSE